MKIISKHKDYYDGVQAYGIDKTLVYNRKEEIITLDTLPSYKSLVEVKGDVSLGIIVLETDKYGDEKSYFHIHKIVIGFCGKLIPAYQLDEYLENEKTSSKVYYKAENLHEFYDKLHKKHNCIEFTMDFTPYSINELNAYLKATIFENNFSSWFQIIQCPVFLMLDDPKNESLNPYEHADKIIIKKNPILKTLDFYKIKDAFTVHQEISQYIGGVLTNNEGLKDNLNDPQKVKKHGFDEKYGFRTRPKKML